MTIETVTTAGAKWLWDKYGKDIVDKARDKLLEKWQEFKWSEAEAKYRDRLRNMYSTTRVLGNPKPIDLEEIFTDVYVLDKPTAFRRYDLEELRSKPLTHESLSLDEKRKPALRLALSKKRLFILGKPGAGKTTFLKYLTLKAVDGKISKTPVFVSLKEWADSKLELLPFLVQQFQICAFPDAQTFITKLLEDGNAPVLFDGLDEVNQEGDQRADMITNLTNFAKRYPDVQICLTCRVAATDYSFDQFTYLELADFDDRQIRIFVGKWYQDDQAKHARFIEQFAKPEHKGLRELARTPLLLALLCLAFDETLAFPHRRVDLYKEALDALLKKWDSSRGIRRDKIYRKLSIGRKEQMLARIAAQNFETGVYFLRRDTLSQQITNYLQQLPSTDVGDLPDGEAVLKAIEAQHGVLVERAHNIYSFSHLTFQEYFTARYIVDNAASGTLNRLVYKHLADDQWHEVFLLTASLLDDADTFFEILLEASTEFIREHSACVSILKWAKEKARSSKSNEVEARAAAIFTALMLMYSNNIDLKFELGEPKTQLVTVAITDQRRQHMMFGFKTVFHPDYPYMESLKLANLVADVLSKGIYDITGKTNVKSQFAKSIPKFSQRLGIELTPKDIERSWKLSREDILVLAQFISVSQLITDCLRLAAVSNRKAIEARILMPPV